MEAKKLLIVFELFLVTLTSIGQTKTVPMVIWAEDFSGFYYPNKSTDPNELTKRNGMNAIYKCNGDSCSIAFNNHSYGNNKPELAISKQSLFTVVVNLYGISGKVVLYFNRSKPNKNVNYFSVYRNKVSEDSVIPIHDIDSVRKYCVLNIEKNTTTKTLLFKSYNRGTSANGQTFYIDDIRLITTDSTTISGESPELSFSAAECTATLGERTEFPALANPHNQKIYYWSTDTTVARANAEGRIMVKDVGETTIYAICHGGKDNNVTYGYQSVSYKLKVNRKSSSDEIFFEGFDNILERGGHTGDLIYNNKQYNIGNNINKLYCGYKCIYFDKQNEHSYYTMGPFNILSNNTCMLYLGVAGGKKTQKETPKIAVKINNDTIFKTDLVDTTHWQSLSIKLDGVTSSSKITISGNKFFLDYVSLVKIANVKVTISKYGYATLYYGDRALKVPYGMTAYSMKLNDTGDMAIPSKVYDSGKIIPKGEAVLLQANPGDYIMEVADDNIETDPDNDLSGTTFAELTTGGDIYYLFGVDLVSGEMGFFWGNDDGKAFINGTHKAYLPIKKDSAKGRKNPLKSVALDMTTLHPSSIKSVKVMDCERDCTHSYNLSGQRVDDSYRGIVIRGGKKYVVR